MVEYIRVQNCRSERPYLCKVTSGNADGEKTFEHLGPTVVVMQRRILTLTSHFLNA
jgi:hypothetical protein